MDFRKNVVEKPTTVVDREAFCGPPSLRHLDPPKNNFKVVIIYLLQKYCLPESTGMRLVSNRIQWKFESFAHKGNGLGEVDA